MTLRLRSSLSAAITLGAAAFALPLAAETAAPAANMAKSPMIESSVSETPFSQDSAPQAELSAARSDANVLAWNNEFAMLGGAKPLRSHTQSQAAKIESFTLDGLQPDFGAPETLSSEFALIDGVTFQPRAPVRQTIGAEFEQTYAFAPSTQTDARLDANATTVGRATKVRLKF